MKKSKLLFDMYSYISIFSSPWMQNPRSLTKFVCWSLAIRWISFLNSFKPCPECEFSLLTAILSPFGSSPWNSSMSASFSLWNHLMLCLLISRSIEEKLIVPSYYHCFFILKLASSKKNGETSYKGSNKSGSTHMLDRYVQLTVSTFVQSLMTVVL